jgi:hypothetical protein
MEDLRDNEDYGHSDGHSDPLRHHKTGPKISTGHRYPPRPSTYFKKRRTEGPAENSFDWQPSLIVGTSFSPHLKPLFQAPTHQETHPAPVDSFTHRIEPSHGSKKIDQTHPSDQHTTTPSHLGRKVLPLDDVPSWPPDTTIYPKPKYSKNLKDTDRIRHRPTTQTPALNRTPPTHTTPRRTQKGYRRLS